MSGDDGEAALEVRARHERTIRFHPTDAGAPEYTLQGVGRRSHGGRGVGDFHSSATVENIFKLYYVFTIRGPMSTNPVSINN